MLLEMAKAPESNIFQQATFPVTPQSGDTQVWPGQAHNNEPTPVTWTSHRDGKLGNKIAPDRIEHAPSKNQTSTPLSNLGVAVGSRLDLINATIRMLTVPFQLDEMLDRLLAQVEALLDIERGWLLLTDPPTGDLVFQSGLGEAKRTGRYKPFRVSQGRGFAGRVAQSDKPLLLTNVDSSTSNALGLPLMLGDQVIGVLVVMNKKGGSFTPDEVKLLNTVTALAALATEKARLQESILAERDRLLDLEEQVRQQVARDLHDGPIQQVSGMVMQADFCQSALHRDPALLSKEMAKIKTLGQQAVQQMRTMLVALRPLELEQHGQGLVAALRVFLKRRQQEVKTTQLSLICRPHDQISRQETQVEKTIFIIVQETVNNALKHAQAKQIKVELKETPTTIETLIGDDGRGFDVAKMMVSYSQRASLGMLNIRERAETAGAELSIESAPGRGTRIILSIPKAKAERLRQRTTTGRLILPPGARQWEEER